jgi:hypothetical protein
VTLCRDLKLFTQAIVAIDSSKFKAVNSRDQNFTPNKIGRRQEQIEQSIQRYLDALETADRTQPVEVEAKTKRLRENSIIPALSLKCWQSNRSASSGTPQIPQAGLRTGLVAGKTQFSRPAGDRH